MAVKGRLNQFLNQLRYQGQDIDSAYIKTHLTTEEALLFQKLRKSEQMHSIRVAKALQELLIEENAVLVKLALFHDIGKTRRPLRFLEKVAAVVITRFFGRGSKKLLRWSFMEAHWNHGDWGASLLEEHGIFNEDLLLYEVIRHHHEPLGSFQGAMEPSNRFVELTMLLKKADAIDEA